MSNEFGELTFAAMAVAISPVPIVAVILILFSPQARRNGIFYLAGWVLGLVVVLGAVLLLPGMQVAMPSFLPPGVSATLRLLAGALCIAAAVVVWLRRPKNGEAHPLPAWMDKIEDFSAARALLLALGLAVVNPKNLAVGFSVLVSLGESDMGTRQALLALLLFVCWGSLTIAAPVFYRVIAGKAADRRLHEWQNWLMHNNTAVMFVLLLLVGALLIGKGLGALVQGNTNYT